MSDQEPTLTLDEAMALLDKHTAETKDKAKKKKRGEEVEKVKDLLVEGAKQGRAGLGGHTQRLLDQIDD